MTLTETHPRRAGAETMAAPGPQVWDDMTVEVALSVMAAARTPHLVICDADGRRTGLVTLARLTAVRNGSGYTDRVRLRDVADGHGTVAEAGHAVRHRRVGALSR
ncbi:hypothetical protein QFZ63_004566 [Streptomyces sp. B3I7]|uniref:CBS domain-containing protein n=1 Tax=Streptomyces sp. B3I7 TaxID=3042269 RepID=UPI002782FFB6|nr:hypothetical protein [Streptomyces sp. B3I7]